MYKPDDFVDICRPGGEVSMRLTRAEWGEAFDAFLKRRGGFVDKVDAYLATLANGFDAAAQETSALVNDTPAGRVMLGQSQAFRCASGAVRSLRHT